jgi:hypothetical protein
MNNSVTYPILRRMLSYTNDQQLHHQCHLIGIQVHLLISRHEYVQQCREMHAYVTQWSTSRLKCIQMTLAISMLNDISLYIP